MPQEGAGHGGRDIMQICCFKYPQRVLEVVTTVIYSRVVLCHWEKVITTVIHRREVGLGHSFVALTVVVLFKEVAQWVKPMTYL